MFTWAGRHRFGILDIRKYFDSVSHEHLLAVLTRKFKDAGLLAWFERILARHETEAGRGLPIGSLTSQHFANFYLGVLDRFVKEVLRRQFYVRYMDDFAVWGDCGGASGSSGPDREVSASGTGAASEGFP